MSIENRSTPFSRSVRTLIKRQPEHRHIKDLKDLRFIVSRGAIDIKVLKDLRHGEGQALALRWQEGVLGDVARGPVPRELPNETRNVRSPEATDVCC